MPAWGWGAAGHEIVCEIAFQELDGRPAQAEIRRLIALDARFATFAAACNGPDDPRQRAAEHFANLPRRTREIVAPVCRLGVPCLFSALEEDVRELARPGVPDARRLELLKFVGHWLGDVHQPFHVSFADDRGGNLIQEVGDACRGDVDLHSVWDTCLVRERVLQGSVRETAAALRSGISEQERLEWADSTPVDWADESFALLRRPEVDYCTRKQGSCWHDLDRKFHLPGQPQRRVVVDASYLDLHAPAVRRRLAQAGVRLAALLDTVLRAPAPAGFPE